MNSEDLKNQIKELKKKIKVYKRINKQVETVKNLKLFNTYLFNYIVPGCVLTGLTLATFYITDNGLPFIKDDIKTNKRYCLEQQDNNLIMNEENYEKKDITYVETKNNELIIKFPWYLNEDGLYERKIRNYSNEIITNKDAYNAVLNRDINYINENLKDYKEQIETINKLTITNNDYIINATLNFIDKNDYIAKEESDLKNIIVTTLNLLISSGAFYLSYKHNKNHVSFVVDDILYKYYQNYQSTEYLEQELTENNEKLMSLNRGNNNVK